MSLKVLKGGTTVVLVSTKRILDNSDNLRMTKNNVKKRRKIIAYF